MSSAPDARGKAWIGYLVAIACLLWVFHDVRWNDLFSRVRTMSWWPLVPAVAADIGGYVAQGARWSLLLRPLGRLSTLEATRAIYAGLFANEMLPLRPGEILRGYLASRWTGLSPVRIFASMLVERLLDGVWLVLAIGVVVFTVPLPRYLVRAEEILAAVIVLAAAVLVYVVAWRNGPIAEDELGVAGAPPGLRGRLSHAIDHMAAALRSIGTARTLSVAAGISGLVLVLQVVSFWLVMEAYHLSLSVWHGAAVLLILRLGTMLPGAPSNIGTYQFFTVLGLTLFGVDKTLATGFSVVVFLILTLPLWIIGGVACGRAGLDLRTIGASLRGAIGRSPGAPPGC